MKPEDLCKSGNEFGEQSALFCWINSKETRQRFPHLFNPATGKPKIYANFNNAGADGDKRTAAIRGARAKQSGSQSGVADIFLPLARHGCHGLYIELKIDRTHPENIKAKKTGKASPDQLAFRDQVREDGFGWALCEGWKAAREVLERYLGPE